MFGMTPVLLTTKGVLGMESSVLHLRPTVHALLLTALHFRLQAWCPGNPSWEPLCKNGGH